MLRSLAPRLAGVAAATVLALALAPAVLAKEGVEVTLAAPISGDAQPGDTVTVFFTLTRITESGTGPLHGSPAFIRLTGRSGGSTEAEAVETRTPGTYRAEIVVPPGGALAAEFGIHGAAVDESGKATGADRVWSYDGVLVAAHAPAAVDPGTFGVAPKPAANPVPAAGGTGGVSAGGPAPAASAPAFDGRLLAGAVAGTLAATLAAGAMIRRRRQLGPTSA